MHNNWTDKVANAPKIVDQFDFRFKDQIGEITKEQLNQIVVNNLAELAITETRKLCMEQIGVLFSEPLDIEVLGYLAVDELKRNHINIFNDSDSYIQTLEKVRDNIYCATFTSNFNTVRFQGIQLTDSNFESQMPITNFTYNCERDQNYFYNYHSNIGEILKHYYSSEFIHAINTKIVNIIDLNQAKTLVNIIQVLNTQIESEIKQEMNDHKEQIEHQIKLAKQTSELTGSKHVVLLDKNGDIVGVKSLESIQKDKTQPDQTPLKIEIPTHSIKSNKFKRKKNLKKKKEKSKRKNRKK